jgi:serine/threonine protein kinase
MRLIENLITVSSLKEIRNDLSENIFPNWGGSSHHSVTLLSESDRGAVYLTRSSVDAQPVVSKYAWVQTGFASSENNVLYEFLILASINRTGVAPLVYSVSPSLCDFELPEEVQALFEPGRTEQLDIRRLDMEYIPGIPLRQLLTKKHAECSTGFIKDALKYTRLTLEKLQQLHSFGIVHGDLHEDNIIVDDSTGVVRLIDFEFADLFMEEVNTLFPGSLSFSRPYLSPRQLEGKRTLPVDDVIRLLESLSRLLYGDAWFQHLDAALSRTGWVRRSPAAAHLAQIKTTANMFESSDFGPGICSQLSPLYPVDGIRRRLANAHALVRLATGLLKDEFYDFLLDEITDIGNSLIH